MELECSEPAILVCNKRLKMTNSVVHVTLQLNYATILPHIFRSKENSRLETKCCICFFIYFCKSSGKVAAAKPYILKERRCKLVAN